MRKFHTPLSSNALIKLSSEIVGRIATFALALYIARALGETTFGLFNYGLALAFVLSQLADLGLQLLMTREVAIHGHQAQRAVATAFRVKLWLSLLVVLLLLWLTASRPGSVRLSFISLGLALLAQTYLEFAVYIFRGQQRLLAEAALLTTARLLTALLAGLVVWRGGSLPGITLSYLAATLLMAGWAVWLIGREGWLRAPAGVSLIRLPLAGPLVRQALPLGIAVFLSIGYTRLAIFMLENQLGESAV
ncbi:MAG: oligosaccharide flippase family protein, partial [Anaerolineales bacterium]|nr:oligosaccharide flippase family protein [Anaerolineales bacterium]